MVLIQFIFVLLINYPLDNHFELSDKHWKTANRTISKVFDFQDIEHEEISISQQEQKLFKLYNDDHTIGYLCFCKTKGRNEYFHYLVVFDEQKTIRQISFIEYTSSHGYQIMNSKWLKQFYGKTPDHYFEYGKNIQAVTGATISGTAITEELNEVNKTIDKIGK